ncbi:MAG: response regulator [Candidatus Obscuribacterales bacterium]|nr:response regulator [Candidatus Obscuribacterales bacterium]
MTHRVLLIEDSPTQLLTITKKLEASGYMVLTARTGAEGLVRAYNELPDLIISDVVMSGINGYQLCRLVKNDPELHSMPIVLLTKLDGSLDRFWGMKSGADRFIPKEPGFSSLVKAVRELLDNSSKEPRLRVMPEAGKAPTSEEINNRLNQLLERLLFEATIIDEVRRLAEEAHNIRIIVDKLFDLMSSILNYEACGLLVNETTESTIFTDCGKTVSEKSFCSYANRIGIQLGIPRIKEKFEDKTYFPQNAVTQPIDVKGQRLGLLVVIPPNDKAYKAGDQKVIRIICEQLSVVLKLYLSHKESASSVI